MSLARYLSKLGALLGSDGKVPAAGLASGAAVGNIGFTPANVSVVNYVSLNGGFVNGVWYQIFTGAGRDTGIYVIDAYLSTQSAGGGMYSIGAVTAPFHLYGGETNSGDIQGLTVHQSGHALGGHNIGLRTRTNYQPGGYQIVELQYNGATLSGMNGTSGKEGFFYLRRLY